MSSRTFLFLKGSDIKKTILPKEKLLKKANLHTSTDGNLKCEVIVSKFL